VLQDLKQCEITKRAKKLVDRGREWKRDKEIQHKKNKGRKGRTLSK
jgi:hypothetical protein